MSSPDCIFSARTLKGALDQAGQVYPSGFDIADETFSGGMLNRRVTITVIPYVPAAEPVAPVIGEDDTETAAAADTGPVAEQDAADAEQLGPQPATAPDPEQVALLAAEATRRNAEILAAALISEAREKAAGIRADAEVALAAARTDAQHIRDDARRQADALLHTARAQADQALLDGSALTEAAHLAAQSLKAAAERVAGDLGHAHRSICDRLDVDVIEARARTATFQLPTTSTSQPSDA